MKHHFLFLFLLLSLLLCSCMQNPATESLPESNVSANTADVQQRLCITANYQKGLGFTVFTADELNGNCGDGLNYLNLTDVNIEIDRSLYPLEEALRKGLISIEEIFAYARIDSRNGFCHETKHTTNGLTHFTYHYSGFDLQIVYDVYETPDGRKHLINEMGIYQDGAEVGHMFTDKETGEPIDYEDWGLSFTVVDATTNGITIHCAQAGGQQIGDLYADGYWTLCIENELLPSKDDAFIFTQPPEQIPFTMNGECTFSIDWTKEYGEIPSGDYQILLTVVDHFDTSQIHTLMKDYHQIQEYKIDFSVP